MMKLGQQAEGVYMKALERYKQEIDNKEQEKKQHLDLHENSIADYRKHQEKMIIKKKITQETNKRVL